jgi:hypothetical protein
MKQRQLVDGLAQIPGAMLFFLDYAVAASWAEY